jgi:hypothetical protein
VRDDSIRAVAGFLLDAARTDVSTNTVVQVIAHWVAEGVTSAELMAACAVARAGAGRRHHATVAEFEQAIRTRLGLTDAGTE